MKKGNKIVIQVSISVVDTFADFMLSRKAKGLSEKTVITYNQHLSAIGKHLDVSIPIDELTKQDLEEMISSMPDAQLASNNIKSYTRTFKPFFSWCNEQGITRLNIQLYNAEETVKEKINEIEEECGEIRKRRKKYLQISCRSERQWSFLRLVCFIHFLDIFEEMLKLYCLSFLFECYSKSPLKRWREPDDLDTITILF